MEFQPEPKLQTVAEAYALDCVDFGARHFGLKLDFSPETIILIETLLDRLHVQMAAAAPSEEQISKFVKMFGSYAGEMFRRNHGGEWGILSDGEPAFRTVGGVVCFPWARVHKRIVGGEEDNVIAWFRYLEENGQSGDLPGGSATGSPPPLPGNTGTNPASWERPPAAEKPRGFLARLFGRQG